MASPPTMPQLVAAEDGQAASSLLMSDESTEVKPEMKAGPEASELDIEEANGTENDGESASATGGNPHFGLQLDLDSVSDLERESCREFFVGHASKTPERYMKIRNYIMQRWEQRRPAYVTKTAVRGGLRDCGDVNAIGRVHAFLESIGAINTGAVAPRRPPPPAPKPKAVYVEVESAYDSAPQVTVDGRRKRRVRDESGKWVDERELEGRTIDHSALEEAANAAAAVKAEKRARKDASAYDPFRLVECGPASSEVVPFHVVMSTEAMVLMDVHAHLTNTEVIGLLGGRYDADTHTVEVRMAWPCDSQSTGLQCEMEPSSELLARERFAARGLEVVGWYHSHPAFIACPSVRDVENQANYQALFKRGDGVQPFVGVIVSPYDPHRMSPASDVAAFFVSDAYDYAHNCRQPVSVPYQQSEIAELDPELTAEVAKVLAKYDAYKHRVPLDEPWPSDLGRTNLQKMLTSVSSWLGAIPPDVASALLTNIAAAAAATPSASL